jgi:hypothetical protein
MLKEKERKKTPLLGKAVPCSLWQIPILSGPLVEVNYLCSPCPPLTSASASHQKNIYLHTNKINMPAASVGHIASTSMVISVCLQVGMCVVKQ